MPYYPTLTEQSTSADFIDVFGGYNHNARIGDAEFYDMENLTSDYYPATGTRARRTVVTELAAPNGMLAKDALVWIDGTSIFYNGLDITAETLGSQGLALTNGAKTLVSMGAYLLIWPDKIYINTVDYDDCGCMENTTTTAELSEDSPATFTVCKADGSDYENVTISSEAPDDPENGDMWLDTSGETHSLKQYSATSAMWISVATTYVRIAYAGIGAGFEEYDGVQISGCEGGGDIADQVDALNGSHIIYGVEDDYIIVIGLLDTAYDQTSGQITVSRTVPDMDYVTEAQNRIWGCKYGIVDGETVNEIYCCALGDFKNWEQYQGISTDSYRASVGSDGQWTGAVTHLGYPMFFKENCYHKVYVSTSGAHQIIETQCRGVQKGSGKSLVVVDEVLYYKGRSGVMAYDGSLPQLIGSDLGGERYYNAVGGAFGSKYYCNMEDSDGVYHLFVYDTSRGLWHKESSMAIQCFAKCDDELYALTETGITGMNGIGMNGLGTLEDTVDWYAVTGTIGYESQNRKYLSRFNLRLLLPRGAWLKLYIQYDSDGLWHHQGQITGAGDRTFVLPVKPRRCDHLQLKLVGHGDMKLFSLAKILEYGSDVE